MHLHLEQISKATEKGRHTVVVMDGAGWHTDDVADDFDNVSVIKCHKISALLPRVESNRTSMELDATALFSQSSI